MKIVAIRGRDLASLEGEFAIEFDKPPLSGAGLFAVCGPVGTGKSTVLDALCLALFNRTPRLAGRGGVAIGSAESTEDERLASTDVRHLLRRGATQAFAEVEFIGVDGDLYRARWSVRRARDRIEGKVQPQKMQVHRIRDGLAFGGTKTETLQAIEAKLGLGFENFRRSVLLAQGDFAAFLKADTKERAQLLERITGTDAYAKVSKAAHERRREWDQKIAAVGARVGGDELLEDVARTRLELDLAAAEAKLAKLRVVEESAASAQAWFTDLTVLRGEVVAAESAVRDVERRLLDAKPAQLRLQRQRAARELGRYVVAYDAARERLRAHEMDRDGAVRTNREAQVALADAEKEGGRATARAESLARSRQAAEAGLVQAREAEAEFARWHERVSAAYRVVGEQREDHRGAVCALREARSAASKASGARDELSAELDRTVCWAGVVAGWDVFGLRSTALIDRVARIEKYERALRSAESALANNEKRRERVEDLARALEGVSASMGGGEVAAVRVAFEAVSARRAAVLAAAEEQRNAAVVCRSLREAVAEVEGIAQQSKAAAVAREKLDGEVRIAGVRLDEAARAAEAARARTDLQDRRHALVEGEPCPLCGAVEHPFAKAAEPPPEWLSQQLQRVEELAAEKERVVSRRGAAEERLGGLLSAERDATAALAAAERAWSAVQPTLESSARVLGEGRDSVVVPDEPPVIAEASIDELVEDAVRAEKDWRERLDKVERLAGRLRRNDTRTRQCASTASSLRQVLTETQHELDGERAELAEDRRILGALVNQTPEPIPSSSCVAGLRSWRERVVAAVQARREVEMRRSQLDAQVESSGRAVADAERLEIDRRRTRSRAVADLQAARDGRRVAHRAYARAIEAACSGLPASLDRDSLTAAGVRTLEEAWQRGLDAVREGAAQARAAHDRAAAEARTAARRLDELRASASLARDEAVRLGLEMRGHLRAAGFRPEEVREAGALDPAGFDQAEEAQRQLAAEVAGCRAAKVERDAMLARHRSVLPPFSPAEARLVHERVVRARAELDAARDDVLVALGADRNARSRHKKALDELASTKAQAAVWLELADLIGSSDGGELRSFVQGLTFQSLLEQADRHLARLAPRYRLVRVPPTASKSYDLDMQVVDLDLGGEIRAVESLSGGETFLVSLALALALSSLSSDRTTIESLFIDEGFGTLDPDSLDTVLSTLEALRTDGRQVGVISHVEGLAERIGTRIQLIRVGTGRSRLEIVGAGDSSNEVRHHVGRE